jgi:glycosyltransferase involved in cell wall biosynthesis
MEAMPLDVEAGVPTDHGVGTQRVPFPVNGRLRATEVHSSNGRRHHGDPVNAHPADGRTKPNTVSVIIPAMNEQQNIGWVLQRMPATVDEVILVDGYSTDGTVDIARAVRPGIVVVKQSGQGKGDALRAGFQAATSDFIVMIDADGSMDPGEMDRYVTPLMNGYDLVKGSRFLAGGGSTDLTPIRRLGSKAFVRMTNALFLIRFTDLCYGYCSFRRECLSSLALTAHGFEIETEIAVHAAKANLRIAEVPSMELERRSGESNLHAFRDGQRVLRTLVRERVSRRRRSVVDPISERALHDWRVIADSVRAGTLRDTPATRGAA